MANRSATGDVKLSMLTTIINTLLDGSKAQAPVGKANIVNLTLASGVGNLQFNRGWLLKNFAITSGNFKDFDLATMVGKELGAGSGKDGLGLAMDVEEICLLVVRCAEGPGKLEIMATVPGAAPINWLRQNTASVSTGGALSVNGIRAWGNFSGDGLDIELASSNVMRLAANGGDVKADVLVLARHDDDESSSSSLSSSSSSTSSAS